MPTEAADGMSTTSAEEFVPRGLTDAYEQEKLDGTHLADEQGAEAPHTPDVAERMTPPLAPPPVPVATPAGNVQYVPLLRAVHVSQTGAQIDDPPQAKIVFEIHKDSISGPVVFQQDIITDVCGPQVSTQTWGTDTHFKKAGAYVQCYWAGWGFEVGVFEKQDENADEYFLVEQREIGECGNIEACTGYGDLTTLLQVPVREPFEANPL